MGQVAVTLVVTPEGPDTDLEKIKAGLKKLNPKDISEDPIGFGLTSLKVMIVRDEDAGLDTDELENKILKIEGVADCRADDITLL